MKNINSINKNKLIDYLHWSFVNVDDYLIIDKLLNTINNAILNINENTIDNYKNSIEYYNILMFGIYNEYCNTIDINHALENNTLENLIDSVLKNKFKQRKYKLKDYISTVYDNYYLNNDIFNKQCDLLKLLLSEDETEYLISVLGDNFDIKYLIRLNNNHAFIENNISKYSDDLNNKDSKLLNILIKIRNNLFRMET